VSLRRWDLAGRSPHATVMEPEAALAILFEDPEPLLGDESRDAMCPQDAANTYDESEDR